MIKTIQTKEKILDDFMNPVTNKFSPKVHKILDVLLDDPLLTDIVFNIIIFKQFNDNESYSKSFKILLEFYLKDLSNYIFMNRPILHSDEIIEVLKERSESPIEVNQLIDKDS